MVSVLHKRTVIYELIICCLDQKQYSVIKATQQFGISRSQLLRNIKHMNCVLLPFRISIGTAPIMFVGKEEDVRIFLFNFFKCFGDLNILTTESSRYGGYVLDIMGRLKDEGVGKLRLCHFRLSLLMSITLIRWQKRCYVSDLLVIENEHLNPFDLQKVTFIINQASLFYKAVRIPHSELIWIYALLLYCISYTRVSFDLDEKTEFSHGHQLNPDLVKMVDAFIDRIVKDKASQLEIQMVRSYLLNLHFLGRISSNFEIVSDQLKEIARSSYGSLYREWYAFIHSNSTKYTFKNIADVATSCTLFFSNLMEYEQAAKIRILFTFQGDPGWGEYLIQASKKICDESAEAQCLLVQTLDRSVLSELKPDVIVSNYDLNIHVQAHCKLLRLSNFPDSDDWSMVREVIDRLALRENQLQIQENIFEEVV